MQFQKDAGLQQTGKLNQSTALKLSKKIHDRYPNNSDALKLAITLLELDGLTGTKAGTLLTIMIYSDKLLEKRGKGASCAKTSEAN